MILWASVAAVISLIALFWMYAGYGCFIWFLSKTKRQSKTQEFFELPSVSLLIMTYNEDQVIEKKIINSLSIDYPRERFEILVVDSQSNDKTAKIVLRFENQGVRLAQEGKRAGKASAINFGLLQARGEIVVVTDANALLAPDVIRLAVRHFSDPAVGAVTAAMEQRDMAKTLVSQQGGFYWRMEKFLRRHESHVHSVIAMSGEFAAYRKAIFVKGNSVVDWYPHGGTDDFEQTLFIVRSGMRVVYEDQAVVWEPAPDTSSDLSKQKIRIITQTIVSIFHNLSMINLRYGWYGLLIFPSRKILPLLSPVLLLLLFIAFLFLQHLLLWKFILYGQVALYGLYGIGYVPRLRSNPVVNIAHFFAQLNILVLQSWLSYWRGVDFTVWDKVQSTRK